MEPLYYVGVLIMAIITFVLSCNLYYLIILQACSILIPDFDGLKYNWFNTLALKVRTMESSMDIDFAINLMWITLCLYGVYACVQGNEFYGYRSASFTYFSMQ